MSEHAEDLLIDSQGLAWQPVGEGAWMKVLRVSEESGQWTALIKQDAGCAFPAHKHLAPAEFFMLEGVIEYRGGVAKTGSYGYEPLGAIHESTVATEDSIYLLTSYGPLAMHNEDGSIGHIVDADSLKALQA